MGFIIGCMLVGFLAKISWDFLQNPAERQKMIKGFQEKPQVSLFVIIWMIFFLMVFLGVFIPVFGQTELTKSGWQVWQVGGIGFLGCWVISWIVDIK